MAMDIRVLAPRGQRAVKIPTFESASLTNRPLSGLLDDAGKGSRTYRCGVVETELHGFLAGKP